MCLLFILAFILYYCKNNLSTITISVAEQGAEEPKLNCLPEPQSWIAASDPALDPYFFI